MIIFGQESVKQHQVSSDLYDRLTYKTTKTVLTYNNFQYPRRPLEEGWTTLDDASREHIEAFYRKGRKTKTSIRIITQDIGEIKSSKIASAIKNNAATFILLYNEKASSREEIGEFLGMNELDMQKYASLRRKNCPGGFREIFIKEMGQSHVWLLEPSFWEHAMFTSHPSERNQIASLAKKHGNIEDGIAEWVYHTKQKYYV